MQIVTPRLGKPDVLHYQAPASAEVPAQMAAWLQWFNRSLGQIDGVARAALAHLWFEAIPRLKTATAASAAPWRNWRWRKTCKARSG